MNTESEMNECKDPTQSITIELPCVMAERVMKLARESNSDLSNIVIEALDRFLREQT